MIDENKLREAVRQLEEMEECWNDITIQEYKKELRILLDFAKQFLAIKGWPEKKELKFNSSVEEFERIGFNEALDLCRFASIKNRPSREEIGLLIYKTIHGFGDETAKEMWSAKHEVSATKELSSKLADAILKLIEEKGD